MNFQHVKAFTTIASVGSFSRAAEHLHLTQPTISAQIQALEKSLGARLFERSAQGIALTQAGHVFRPYALQMLEVAERAEQAIAELQGLARGSLSVGASSVPGHYVLPRLLALYKEQHPGIDVSLEVSNSQDVREGVRDGRFEIGLVGEQVRDERLSYRPLVSDQLVVAMRPGHPLAGRASLTPADLSGQRLVMREHGSATRATLERALVQAHVLPGSLQVLMELGSAEAVKKVVASVDSLAVLSEWSVADEQRMGLLRVVPLAGLDLRRELFLVRRTHGLLSRAGEAFVTFLAEELQPRPEPQPEPQRR
ncbi:MAG: selenium metabolism-associated LysR family transcriptional regulator [Armatimonadota bacterium]